MKILVIGPSWVGDLNVLTFATGLVTNPSADSSIWTTITTADSAPSTAEAFQHVHNSGGTASMNIDVHRQNISAPGSTISRYGWHKISTGTATGDGYTLQASLTGIR